MAIISGYKGRLGLETTTTGWGAAQSLKTHLISWTLTLDREVHANIQILTTALTIADTNVLCARSEPGYTAWSGSVEGYVDSREDPPLDARILHGAHRIFLSDGDKNLYYGLCHFSSLSVENPVDGFVTFAASFHGDGLLRISDSSS